MEIDKEINRSLAITLLKSREAVMNRFRPMLASAKITEQQWRVLRGLSEYGEVEAGKLAIIACILPQSLSRISRNFEKQNLRDAHFANVARRTKRFSVFYSLNVFGKQVFGF